eukprot:GEZU01033462.1.p1 GENE.GEZU01033462.1~~GEZU01033462.1.p1  ORF type:complete len:217 (-),score=60.07 GEZU01033462.1:35-685(-)
MTILHVETIIPLDIDTFFEIFYENPYESWQAINVGLKGIQVLEYNPQEVDGRQITKRRVKVIPDVTLPSLLLSYLEGGELAYIDNQVKDWAKKRVDFSITPPVYVDKIKVWGYVQLEPIDSNSCKQHLEIHVEIDAWGIIKSPLEQLIAYNLERGYKLIPGAVQSWIDHCKKNNIEVKTVFRDGAVMRTSQDVLASLKPASGSTNMNELEFAARSQ